jgi:hypothetical protein
MNCQMLPEMDVYKDHISIAHATKEDQLMDILAHLAQLDKLDHTTVLTKHNALQLQLVLDKIKSEELLMQTTVVLAECANGQFKNQMHQELHVSTDHLLNAQTA